MRPVDLIRLSAADVLALGFLLGVVFPALFSRWLTPPSGNHAEVTA